MDIYVGLSEGSVANAGESPSWTSYSDFNAGIELLFQQAADRGTRSWVTRKVPVQVWLSGALARPFLCGPVDGLRRWHEVVSLAEAAAPDATGLDGPCAVEVEGWPHPQAALAVAVEAWTVDAIKQAARAHRVAIRAIRPWWALALNRATATNADLQLVAIAEGDATTLFSGQGDRLELAAGYVPNPSPGQVDQLLARSALTAGIPAERALRIEFERTTALSDHGLVPSAAREQQA